jgi:predicted Zn-dependent protease
VVERHVAVVPVGKLGSEELEPAVRAVSRTLRLPLELKSVALPLPAGIGDRERGQFRASVLLQSLRASFAQLGPGRILAPDVPDAQAPPRKPDVIVFVTDADLYTSSSEAAFTALLPAKGLGVVSVRRLREAFYRRSADPNRQRARLTKELLRAIARLLAMPECRTPQCALAPSPMLADIDLKDDRPCRPCLQRWFKGTVAI